MGNARAIRAARTVDALGAKSRSLALLKSQLNAQLRDITLEVAPRDVVRCRARKLDLEIGKRAGEVTPSSKSSYLQAPSGQKYVVWQREPPSVNV